MQPITQQKKSDNFPLKTVLFLYIFLALTEPLIGNTVKM